MCIRAQWHHVIRPPLVPWTRVQPRQWREDGHQPVEVGQCSWFHLAIPTAQIEADPAHPCFLCAGHCSLRRQVSPRPSRASDSSTWRARTSTATMRSASSLLCLAVAVLVAQAAAVFRSPIQRRVGFLAPCQRSTGRLCGPSQHMACPARRNRGNVVCVANESPVKPIPSFVQGANKAIVGSVKGEWRF